LRQASREQVGRALTAAREHTLKLLEHLSAAQWQVPFADEINPPAWELGHVGWFQEYWCQRLRQDQGVGASILASSDRWFDSARVAHQTRWTLDLPTERQLRAYLANTLEVTLEGLERAPDSEQGLYFYKLALFHEQMHAEAFCMTWQRLGYAAPPTLPVLGALQGQAEMLAFEGGEILLGNVPGQGFVFDNEKWATPVVVAPFSISSQPVSNAQFLEFVNADGVAKNRPTPRHWRKTPEGMQEQMFGSTAPLNLQAPVMNISAFEAQAYCLWAGKRLPTEAQWQFAATNSSAFEWGQHVWEWTSSIFNPLPGFTADPYKEYSEPWFGTHVVVKGASFATNPGLVDPRFRNFYLPHRNDPFVGFRVCEY
jgi:gamma-glutamyl hercynylcysteine S-oxide synthase